MAYLRKSLVARTGYAGFGDASDCSDDEVWDPTFNTHIPFAPVGQCVPKAQPATTTSSNSGSSSSSPLDFILGLFKGATSQAPAQPTPTKPPAASGMSTTTMVVIGAVAIGVVALIATR